MAEQTRQAIRNIETVLEAAGATLQDVVQVTVYVTDMRLFKESCEARMEFFRTDLPTSTTVEVQHLTDPRLMIEIQALAAIYNGGNYVVTAKVTRTYLEIFLYLRHKAICVARTSGV